MPETKISEELAAAQSRVTNLRGRARDLLLPQHGLLPEAFEEWHTTVEELRVAEEEMRAQNEELMRTRRRVEAEKQRYQDLFEFAPDGYVVTTLDGKILEANHAASVLLNIAPRFLKNRPLAGSVYEEDLRDFHTRLAALRQNPLAAGRQEWTLRLRRRKIGPFYAALTVSPVTALPHEPATLRWLVRDITERRHAEEERRIAETPQRALLRTIPPDTYPQLTIETLYRAASEEAQVGGDFFNVFTLSEGQIALVVGDVSGKGLVAEMTAQVKYGLRVLLRDARQPGLALARLNDFLCEAQSQGDWGSDHLVALTLAIVNPETGETLITAAGSEPLLWRASGDWEPAFSEGVILGVQPGLIYAESRVTLAPGDTLLIVTDGITEARRAGALLGMDGLRQMIAEQAQTGGTLRELGQRILDGVHSYVGGALRDDACLLLTRRRVVF